jgi:hypothetical protein
VIVSSFFFLLFSFLLKYMFFLFFFLFFNFSPCVYYCSLSSFTHLEKFFYFLNSVIKLQFIIHCFLQFGIYFFDLSFLPLDFFVKVLLIFNFIIQYYLNTERSFKSLDLISFFLLDFLWT